MSGEVAYRGPKVGTSASFDTYSQSQEDVPNTTRSTLELNGERYVANRWKYIALTTFEHNDELALDLRVTLGGGVGRPFVQTNSNELAFETTLVGTRERVHRPGRTPQPRSGISKVGSRSRGMRSATTVPSSTCPWI